MPMFTNPANVWRKLAPSLTGAGVHRKIAKGHITHGGVWRTYYSGLPLVGEAYQGGFMAGVIDTTAAGGLRYLLLVAPRAVWSDTARSFNGRHAVTPSANWASRWNGRANTDALASASPSSLAAQARALTSGGFDDWYLPAADELELMYRSLKPTAGANTAGQGGNPSSSPTGAAYTSTVPGQSRVKAFQTGGAQALSAAAFWSSTWDRDSTETITTEQRASAWNEAGTSVSNSGWSGSVAEAAPGATSGLLSLSQNGAFVTTVSISTPAFPSLSAGALGAVQAVPFSFNLSGQTISGTARWKNSRHVNQQVPLQYAKQRRFDNGSEVTATLDTSVAARPVRRVIF